MCLSIDLWKILQLIVDPTMIAIKSRQKEQMTREKMHWHVLLALISFSILSAHFTQHSNWWLRVPCLLDVVIVFVCLCALQYLFLHPPSLPPPPGRQGQFFQRHV